MEEKKKMVRDHYKVLGLPSGKAGTKLNKRAITKAYRQQALQLHPDKRPNDPNANAKFQRLRSSYATLMDPQARKEFDAFLLRLNNKPSPVEPENKTSDEREREDHEDELFLLGYLIFVIGPMVFPAGRTVASFVFRGVCLMVGINQLRNRQQLEKVWSIVVRVANYSYRNAATNQESESQEEDHEEIEDWVMV